ncbi:MAG: DUF3047 domain-containing protein [Desulfopila sp.]|jgi:hypothetical protein|nr:DUF3047 domain-containing protein [Desulfopila sp.]
MNAVTSQKKFFSSIIDTLAFVVLLSVTFSTTAFAGELPIGRFTAEGLAGWEEKSFKGNTKYRLVKEGDRMVVEANSRGTASGMFKELRFDPEQYRWLRWSWKIDKTLTEGDERTKAGDDYAARVYVVFPGTFFWQTKAINYIWANTLSQGEAIANAYTSSAMMVAVQSGDENSGRWLTEERDIYSDYEELFGSPPGAAGAVAIMTDTDDTGGSATAWYGDITLSSQPQP